MLDDGSYDFSNGRGFAKDLERIESSEDFDFETDVADISLVSNASTLVDELSRVQCGFQTLTLSLQIMVYTNCQTENVKSRLGARPINGVPTIVELNCLVLAAPERKLMPKSTPR